MRAMLRRLWEKLIGRPATPGVYLVESGEYALVGRLEPTCVLEAERDGQRFRFEGRTWEETRELYHAFAEGC